MADAPEVDRRANQLHRNRLLDVVLEVKKVRRTHDGKQAGEDAVGIALHPNKEPERSNLDVRQARKLARLIAKLLRD
jgi:hypothetical protein